MLSPAVCPAMKLNNHGRRYAAWAIAAVVFAALCFASQTASAQTTNVFGRTNSVARDAVNATASARRAGDHGAAPYIEIPSPVLRAVGATIRLQSKLDAELEDTLAGQREGSNPLALLALIAFSFGYGVLHALGPGHGKLAVSAYLMSHRARVAHAVALSAWGACVQTLSAIALVGGAAWITREGLGGVLTQASSLDLVSYVALLAVAVWTIWSIATHRDCCDEVRVRLVPKKRFGFVGSPAEIEPRVDEHGAYLGNRLAKACRYPVQSRVEPREGTRWIARQIFFTGLAIGVRPCVGAIFVLIAGLANGVFMTGVLAAFAIGAGVALTVLVIGLTSLGVNRLVSTREQSRRRILENIRFRLALSGALFITIFTGWQVFAILVGLHSTSLA